MIISCIVIIYIILVIYKTLQIYKYNENGILVYINDINDINDINQINENLRLKNPFILNYENKIDYDDLIQEKPSYLINHGNDIFPLKSFKDENIFNIYKNEKIVNSFDIKNKLINLKFLKDYQYLFFKKYSLSLLKGNIKIPLQKCNHDYNIIGNISGESFIYIFNPKHNEEINNNYSDKNNDKIKKWGHKINLKKDEVLFIPTGWSYIQEVSLETFQYHIEIDSIFTFIPNFVNDIKG
tara:strand:+ start:753 stop:1472 length:720 start_codon:yes stop_codon:yes gene_type:complete